MLRRAIVILVAASGLAADVPQVGQWDRFETPIRNSKTYSNPYRDVTLEVIYTSPAGR